MADSNRGDNQVRLSKLSGVVGLGALIAVLVGCSDKPPSNNEIMSLIRESKGMPEPIWIRCGAVVERGSELHKELTNLVESGAIDPGYEGFMTTFSANEEYEEKIHSVEYVNSRFFRSFKPYMLKKDITEIVDTRFDSENGVMTVQYSQNFEISEYGQHLLTLDAGKYVNEGCQDFRKILERTPEDEVLLRKWESGWKVD